MAMDSCWPAPDRMAAVLYTLMTLFPNPANRPAAKEVLAKFRAKGIDPAGYALDAYAATQILKQAVDRAGTLDTRRVAETMHSGVPFKRVLGEIAFDQKGDIKQLGFVPYIRKNTGAGSPMSSSSQEPEKQAAIRGASLTHGLVRSGSSQEISAAAGRSTAPRLSGRPAYFRAVPGVDLPHPEGSASISLEHWHLLARR